MIFGPKVTLVLLGRGSGYNFAGCLFCKTLVSHIGAVGQCHLCVYIHVLLTNLALIQGNLMVNGPLGRTILSSKHLICPRISATDEACEIE